MTQKQRKKQMMRLKTLLISFSVLISSCAVERPNTNICVINSLGSPHKNCANLHDDYDNDGNLKPGFKPKVIPISSLSDLDKNTCTDSLGIENLKVYIRELRLYIKTLEGKK